MKSLIFARACLILLLGTVLESTAKKVVQADHPLIRYTGRFDFENPKSPSGDWPGITISAAFTGTSISAQLTDGYANYIVYIDEKEQPILSTQPVSKEYILAQGLDNRKHTVRLIRKNEAHYNKLTFTGFLLDDNAELIELPARSEKRMEFIGASWTAGYGVESSSRECTENQVAQTTNIVKSFGYLIASHYNAEAQFHAWGGKGIVRNYGSTTSADPLNAFPAFYYRIRTTGTSRWDFSQWHPSLIVIQLGGNDFSTEPVATETDFKNAYNSLIDSLFSYHPQTKIILFGMSGTLLPTYLKAVAKYQNAKRIKPESVFYLPGPLGLEKNGCHWHPGITDHLNIANAFINYIDSNNILDSKTTLYSQKNENAGTYLKVHKQIELNRLQLTLSDHSIRQICLYTLSGKKISTVPITTTMPLSLDMKNLTQGVYFIGLTGPTGTKTVKIHW